MSLPPLKVSLAIFKSSSVLFICSAIKWKHVDMLGLLHGWVVVEGLIGGPAGDAGASGVTSAGDCGATAPFVTGGCCIAAAGCCCGATPSMIK